MTPPKPSTVPVGELPWFARTKPGEMMKAAEARQTQMSNSKEGLRISGARISFT